MKIFFCYICKMKLFTKLEINFHRKQKHEVISLIIQPPMCSLPRAISAQTQLGLQGDGVYESITGGS